MKKRPGGTTHLSISLPTEEAKILRRRARRVYDGNLSLAEGWRGRTDRREAVLRGLLVETVTNEVMKVAGLALGKVRTATAIDAIVAAFAVQRSSIVYTSDVTNFESLQAFFPALRA